MLTLNRAMDSSPLSDDSTHCRDHSGSQIFRLTTLTWRDAWTLKNNSEDGKIYHFELKMGNFWSDGRALSVEDFLNQMKRVLSNPRFAFERLWLSNIGNISTQGRLVTFHLKGPDFDFLDYLDLLSFAPDHGQWGRYCGKFKIENREDDKIELLPNPYRPTPMTHSLTYLRIKSPQENMLAYFANRIDATADTAFPYSDFYSLANHPDLRIEPSHIFMGIRFSKSIAGRDFLPLRRAIQDLLPPEIFESCVSPLLTPFPKSPQREKRTDRIKSHPLALAYDPYYPNLELVSEVARRLLGRGIQTKLLMDSYEKPFQKYDLKLTLAKPLVQSEIGLISGLIFEEPIKFSAETFSTFAKLVFGYRALPKTQTSARRAYLDELWAMVFSNAAIIPLLNMPAIWLERTRASHDVA